MTSSRPRRASQSSNVKTIKHAVSFIDNMGEVDRLREIHRQIAGNKPGRKYDVEILNKSAIVLMVACWEAYVEDLAEAALSEMLSSGKNHKVFPKYVLDRIASIQSGANAWSLAGDGWRRVIRGNLKGVLDKTTGALNTPKTEQTNELFKKTIGLDELSGAWYWPGRTRASAEETLDKLVTLRGSIAHRVTTADSVTLVDVKRAREFINRIAVKSHNAVCQHVETRVGKPPWNPLYFGKTK